MYSELLGRVTVKKHPVVFEPFGKLVTINFSSYDLLLLSRVFIALAINNIMNTINNYDGMMMIIIVIIFIKIISMMMMMLRRTMYSVGRVLLLAPGQSSHHSL